MKKSKAQVVEVGSAVDAIPATHRGRKPKVVSPPLNKKSRVISLLQRRQGASLSELMSLTGWQAHSVRGFISGTLRKRAGLNVVLADQRYRIAA